MNTKLPNPENFWTIIIWISIFMFVLVWDQEKIVVVNLVVFCYFLYYMASSSIESTLAARRETLVEALILDFNTLLANLNKVVSDTNLVKDVYAQIVLITIKKAFFTVISLFKKQRFQHSFLNNFVLAHYNLQILGSQDSVLQAHLNLFVVNELVRDFDSASPAFAGEIIVPDDQ